RARAVIAAALVCLLGAPASSRSQAPPLVAYDFEASTHGWLISGDTGAFGPELHASGGDPGGYISHVDEALGETWYFPAPDSMLAGLAAAEHGTLSYRLKQSADVPGFVDDDIIIVGRAGRLSFRFPTTPGTGWTPFSVKLAAGPGWRFNWNMPASQEQI